MNKNHEGIIHNKYIEKIGQEIILGKDKKGGSL